MKGIRRILAFLLALVLLVSVCACSSAPDEPSAPVSQEDPGAEISPSEEEAPVAAPETVPEDTTQLTVPLQVTSPDPDFYSWGELSYTTEAEADLCRRWLYDLKAGDITALYGNTGPTDHYWTGEMSLEDSSRVIELLRSMAPRLSPLAEGNPATGGSWMIAVQTGDEMVNLHCDSYWFTFTREGKTWILDGSDASAQEIDREINSILGKYANSQSPITETYFSDNVQAIYALDRENYVMAEVKDGYVNSKAIWEGLQNRVPSDGEPSGYGYLVITDEGKEYVYMNFSDEDTALNKYCQAALIAGPLHPSWLIHMTPERMEKVVMMGAGSTTDRDELLTVAKFLKEEVTVRPEAVIHDGVENPDMPAGLYFWQITFDSGVEYTLIGYAGGDHFSLYASDLDKHINYQLEEGVDWKFIEFEGRDWP